MPRSETTELLLLPDGQILVHNLTVGVAGILSALAPEDAMMRDRANAASPPLGAPELPDTANIAASAPSHDHSERN